MRRGAGVLWRLSLVAALAPAAYGCALLAGLEDREVAETTSTSTGSGGSGGMGTGGMGAGGMGTTGPGGGGMGGAGGGCNEVDGGAGPVAIAATGALPRALAVLGGDIYWTTEGTEAGDNAIWKMDKDCLAPRKIADSGMKKPVALTVDSATVFWSSDGAAEGTCAMSPNRDPIMQVPKDGPPEPVAFNTMCGKAQSVALDVNRVYWARPLSYRLQSRDKTGGSVQAIFDDSMASEPKGQPYGVVVDANSVYWTDNVLSKVVVYAKNGGAAMDFAVLAAAPTWIGLDDQDVYWTTATELMKLDKGSPGGAVTTIATGLQNPGGIAVDGSGGSGGSVYVVNTGAGNVLKILKGGGTPAELVNGTDNLLGIAVDDLYVYWTNATTKQIVRAPK